MRWFHVVVVLPCQVIRDLLELPLSNVWGQVKDVLNRGRKTQSPHVL
jgi:hypothetical protein